MATCVVGRGPSARRPLLEDADPIDGGRHHGSRGLEMLRCQAGHLQAWCSFPSSAVGAADRVHDRRVADLRCVVRRDGGRPPGLWVSALTATLAELPLAVILITTAVRTLRLTVTRLWQLDPGMPPWRLPLLP